MDVDEIVSSDEEGAPEDESEVYFLENSLVHIFHQQSFILNGKMFIV